MSGIFVGIFPVVHMYSAKFGYLNTQTEISVIFLPSLDCLSIFWYSFDCWSGESLLQYYRRSCCQHSHCYPINTTIPMGIVTIILGHPVKHWNCSSDVQLQRCRVGDIGRVFVWYLALKNQIHSICRSLSSFPFVRQEDLRMQCQKPRGIVRPNNSSLITNCRSPSWGPRQMHERLQHGKPD